MEVSLWLNKRSQMLLKVDCLPNAVGKQPSIPLIDLGRKWTLSWWWWWWCHNERVGGISRGLRPKGCLGNGFFARPTPMMMGMTGMMMGMTGMMMGMMTGMMMGMMGMMMIFWKPKVCWYLLQVVNVRRLNHLVETVGAWAFRVPGGVMGWPTVTISPMRITSHVVSVRYGSWIVIICWLRMYALRPAASSCKL